MITWKPLFAAALVAAVFAGTASAQHTVSDHTFGYPDTTCQSNRGLLRGQGHFQNFKAKMDYYSALNQKKYARNDAWPKPFACWDRRAYHQFWTPYLAEGLHQRSIISADFFDPETNELTKQGIHQVAGIMKNVPEHDRSVYIQRVADDNANRARLASVKNTIDTYYAHYGVARIDFTNRAPSMVSGIAADTLQQKRMDSIVNPTIDIGTGGSVNAAVAGN